MFGPGLIAWGQSAEHFGVGRRVFPRGDDESPGLLVVAGRCPACRFKKTAKDIVRNRLRRESAGAPALANQVVDRVVCAGGFLHSQLSEWLQQHLGKIAARLAGRPGEWLLPKSLRVATDFVADDNATGVEGLVPGNSKILAVNFGGTGNGSTLQAPRIPDGRLGSGNLKNCSLGHAANGQVACDFEPAGSGGFDLGGLESHVGYLATSKKSELLRCLSRSGSRV